MYTVKEICFLLQRIDQSLTLESINYICKKKMFEKCIS